MLEAITAIAFALAIVGSIADLYSLAQVDGRLLLAFAGGGTIALFISLTIRRYSATRKGAATIGAILVLALAGAAVLEGLRGEDGPSNPVTLPDGGPTPSPAPPPPGASSATTETPHATNFPPGLGNLTVAPYPGNGTAIADHPIAATGGGAAIANGPGAIGGRTNGADGNAWDANGHGGNVPGVNGRDADRRDAHGRDNGPGMGGRDANGPGRSGPTTTPPGPDTGNSDQPSPPSPTAGPGGPPPVLDVTYPRSGYRMEHLDKSQGSITNATGGVEVWALTRAGDDGRFYPQGPCTSDGQRWGCTSVAFRGGDVVQPCLLRMAVLDATTALKLALGQESGFAEAELPRLLSSTDVVVNC
ncbi:hypothetical protein ACQPZX_29110 [Actinoplanes sp. CA-142083]|uniref:hypothetical protein n=1 Tax=Actinoplanes sp. CA-142083 TaxID=3239903 RepID=UPI003D934132